MAEAEEAIGPEEDETLDEELCERFLLASSYARFGPCTSPRPSWYALEAKQKWDAWSKLKEMSREDAMKGYISFLESIDADWESKSASGGGGQNWVAVSTMANGEALIDDADKTVFDWVKEGNFERFKQTITARNVNRKDADGLGLIHWAADRGNLEIIQYLVVELKANIDLRDEDGQTAVHYAASCGHREVLQFLVDRGAKKSIEDNDGIKPVDIAADLDIRNILIV